MEIYEEIRVDKEQGAKRMVAAYKDRLYSAALMFGCNLHDAEDLVFRTFAQGLAKIRRFKVGKKVEKRGGGGERGKLGEGFNTNLTNLTNLNESAGGEVLTQRSRGAEVDGEEGKRAEKESDPFYNWLFTIMVNFRKMDIRKSRRRVTLEFPEELPEVAAVEPDAWGRLAAKTDATRVRAAVERLPEGLKEAVVLRYFEDMETPEIAQILKIPEGTVRSRLHYAKNLLYSYLNV